VSKRRGILYGMPVILTDDGGCTPANWFAGIVVDVMVTLFGFNGAVLEYEDGNYWGALWSWMTGRGIEE